MHKTLFSKHQFTFKLQFVHYNVWLSKQKTYCTYSYRKPAKLWIQYLNTRFVLHSIILTSYLYLSPTFTLHQHQRLYIFSWFLPNPIILLILSVILSIPFELDILATIFDWEVVKKLKTYPKILHWKS